MEVQNLWRGGGGGGGGALIWKSGGHAELEVSMMALEWCLTCGGRSGVASDSEGSGVSHVEEGPSSGGDRSPDVEE